MDNSNRRVTDRDQTPSNNRADRERTASGVWVNRNITMTESEGRIGHTAERDRDFQEIEQSERLRRRKKTEHNARRKIRTK